MITILCECGKVGVLNAGVMAAEVVVWTAPRAGVCPSCHLHDVSLARALGHMPGINPIPMQGGRPQPTAIPAGSAGSTPAPATPISAKELACL